MQEEIKIPKERIAVLIGEKGATKRKLQKKIDVKITVSSEDGDVLLESEDSLKVFVGTNVIRAIGRGFNPEVALKLVDENYTFEIVNIHDFSGKSKKQEERIKSRVIGTNGKARRSIEKMTETRISIYGKTVGIIGKLDDVYLAKRALEKLLQGVPHNNVYKWIDITKERENLQ
jgi:ribosomal RNA assembly protein